MSETELPEFAVVVRGYDKQQVDDYVATLRQYLEEMTRRVHAAEQVSTERSRTLELPAASGALGLGEHVEQIVQAAHQAAERILADASSRAGDTVERANRSSEDGLAVVSGARAEADQITSRARNEASELLSRAREHAEQRAETLLTQTQQEADRLRLTATEDAQSRAEYLQAEINRLEQRHDEVQSTIATLRSVLDGSASQPTGSTTS